MKIPEETPELIEKMCREMCRHCGEDPDRLVSPGQAVLMHWGHALGGPAYPNWTYWRQTFSTALAGLREADLTSTKETTT